MHLKVKVPMVEVGGWVGADSGDYFLIIFVIILLFFLKGGGGGGEGIKWSRLSKGRSRGFRQDW